MPRPSRAKVKPKRAVARNRSTLARPGDPLVTGTGLVVQPERSPGEHVDPLNISARDFRARKKKSISELAAPPRVMNGIAAAIVYTALGVQDSDIEDALNIQRGTIKRIREHEAYTDAFNAVLSELINANSSLLTSRIQAYAHDALTTVANIAVSGEKEANKLRASDSILDRAGTRPQDNVTRVNMGKNDLRILVVTADNEVQVDIGGFNGEEAVPS